MKTYVAVPTIADDQDLDVGHIRDTWTTWMNGHKEDIKALENKLSLSEANADNAIANAEKLYSDQISELKNALALATTNTSSNSNAASTTGDSTSSISLYAAELEKVAKDKEALQHSLTGNISSTLLLSPPPLPPSHHHHYHHRIIIIIIIIEYKSKSRKLEVDIEHHQKAEEQLK